MLQKEKPSPSLAHSIVCLNIILNSHRPEAAVTVDFLSRPSDCYVTT